MEEMTFKKILPTSENRPLSQIRRELKIKWYRCPIEPKELRKLSKPSDSKGLFMALGHLALWSLTGASCFFFASQHLWIAFIFTLFFHGTIGTFFTAPHHELCHGTVFKTKRLNGFFLRIFATLGMLNFHIYKLSHSYHHRFTLYSGADKEVVLPKPPSLNLFYLLQLFTFNFTGGFESRGFVPTLKGHIRVAFNQMESPFNDWGEELYKEDPEECLKAVNWARFILGFHIVSSVAFISIGHPILILVISAHIFIGNWLRYFVGAPMHCGLRSDVADFRKCVRTITLNPVSEFLYWNMNWHLEHHMFAAVPCYNLKKLHKTVARDMPKPRTLVESWVEMRNVWKRQQNDPGYAFDTPVPEGNLNNEKKQDEYLKSSIGDLAPSTIILS